MAVPAGRWRCSAPLCSSGGGARPSSPMTRSLPPGSPPSTPPAGWVSTTGVTSVNVSRSAGPHCRGEAAPRPPLPRGPPCPAEAQASGVCLPGMARARPGRSPPARAALARVMRGLAPPHALPAPAALRHRPCCPMPSVFVHKRSIKALLAGGGASLDLRKRGQGAGERPWPGRAGPGGGARGRACCASPAAPLGKSGGSCRPRRAAASRSERAARGGGSGGRGSTRGRRGGRRQARGRGGLVGCTTAAPGEKETFPGEPQLGEPAPCGCGAGPLRGGAGVRGRDGRGAAGWGGARSPAAGSDRNRAGGAWVGKAAGKAGDCRRLAVPWAVACSGGGG